MRGFVCVEHRMKNRSERGIMYEALEGTYYKEVCPLRYT